MDSNHTSSCELADRTCLPCRGGVPPLGPDEFGPLLANLDGWQVVGKHHLQKSYEFPDFAQALAFVNRVGTVAEASGHHPDVYLGWGKVRLELWTHKIDGLSESDFIIAAKCDRVR
jgi:4a-hydroxytetrahydrobiopterin dehydratase